MKEIAIEELNENPFKLISKDWFLIIAEKDGKTNMMTASWGGLGVIWNKTTATVYVRKSRYTKSFLDSEKTFTLCFFDEKYRKELGYCGKISGKNEDKVASCGFTVDHVDGAAYFKECRMVFVCKKIYSQEMAAENFDTDSENLVSTFYNDNDWHVMYIAEIKKVYVN